MQNIIVIIAMLLLCIGAKDKRLLLLIAGSSGAFELLYLANMDIALYYGVCGMLSVITALIAIINIKTSSAMVLSVFMLIQSLMCLSLVPEWGAAVNESLQFKLMRYNDILVFILIGIGIASNDRCTNTR